MMNDDKNHRLINIFVVILTGIFVIGVAIYGSMELSAIEQKAIAEVKAERNNQNSKLTQRVEQLENEVQILQKRIEQLEKPQTQQ